MHSEEERSGQYVSYSMSMGRNRQVTSPEVVDDLCWARSMFVQPPQSSLQLGTSSVPGILFDTVETLGNVPE